MKEHLRIKTVKTGAQEMHIAREETSYRGIRRRQTEPQELSFARRKTMACTEGTSLSYKGRPPGGGVLKVTFTWKLGKFLLSMT